MSVRTYIYLAVLTFLLLTATYVLCSRSEEPGGVSPSLADGPAVVAAPEGSPLVSSESAPPESVAAAEATGSVPEDVVGKPIGPVVVPVGTPEEMPYAGSPLKERLALVDAWMLRTNLDERERAFLEGLLTDPDLGELERNNICVILHRQDHPDPRLYETLLAMLEDPRQSQKWRGYCTQHLAQAYRYSAEPERIERALRAQAFADLSPLATRSLMALSALRHQGLIEPDAREEERIGVFLDASRVPVGSQVAALSIIGRNSLYQYLPEVRSLASRSGPTQRVAVAALGSIGETADLDMLEALENSSDRLVALAAQGAVRTLRRRLESPE